VLKLKKEFRRQKVKARLLSNYSRSKAISVTYSDWLILALVISRKNTYAVLNCRLCPVWLYHMFPHSLITGTIFGKKVVEDKVRVLTFSPNLV